MKTLIVVLAFTAVTACWCQEIVQEISEPSVLDSTHFDKIDTESSNITSDTDVPDITEQTEPEGDSADKPIGPAIKPKNETGKVTCTVRNDTYASVEIINGTALLSFLVPQLNATTNTTLKNYDPAPCLMVMFYSPYCVFSARMAPVFNALPRFYDKIAFFGLDIIASSQLNMRYGLVAVPTILLFHNGRAVAKFNETTPSLDSYAVFIERHTTLKPLDNITFEISPDDYAGPLSTTALPHTDWLLVASWLLVISCCIYHLCRSATFLRAVEVIKTTWRESQQERPHQD